MGTGSERQAAALTIHTGQLPLVTGGCSLRASQAIHHPPPRRYRVSGPPTGRGVSRSIIVCCNRICCSPKRGGTVSVVPCQFDPRLVWVSRRRGGVSARRRTPRYSSVVHQRRCQTHDVASFLPRQPNPTRAGWGCERWFTNGHGGPDVSFPIFGRCCAFLSPFVPPPSFPSLLASQTVVTSAAECATGVDYAAASSCC